MAREWTERELTHLEYARTHKKCGFNPVWGRCHHPQCHALWSLTLEQATAQEKTVLFAQKEVK